MSSARARRPSNADLLLAITDLKTEFLQKLDQLVTGGARDAADLDLVEALHAVMGESPFLCRRAIACAKEPPKQTLRDALEAAQVNGAKSLGHALSRVSKDAIGVVEVLRLKEGRVGVMWQLRARVLRVCFEKPA